MSNLKELEKKLQIDEHQLEIALREHPDLFYKVATEVALAISNRDEAKQNLVEIESQVDMELRKAAAISDTKTTEKEVESNRKVDKRVKSANDAYLAAHYEAAKWNALKDAYESRSYALSKLVDLHLANYYSGDNGQKNAQRAQMTLRDAQADRVKAENRSKRVQV